MNGIFEDDDGIRKPVLKPARAGSASADKLLKKAGVKSSLADIASSAQSKSVSFDEIDFNKIKAAAKSAKVDDGKIIPTINYIGDEDGTA